MAKKNKVIYLEAPHKYNFGSFMQGIESGKGLGKFGSQYAGLSSGMQGALGGLGSMVGQMAGSAISGGLESGAGNVISGLSSVASAIPGPWGAVASAGLGVVGGLVNAAFGIKEDKEKHQRLNQSTDYLNKFNSNASTFDEVTDPQAVTLASDVYKGGWFSKGKARRKNQELAREAQAALDKADRDVVNNVTTLTKNQMNDLEGSYFAFGGPLDFGLMPIGGAIDYELAQRRLSQKDLEIEAKKAFGGPLHTHGADWTNGITIIDNGGSHESNPFEGVPMGIAPDGQPNLVEEGEVIFNDYVFSNRLRVPKAVREKYKLRGQKEMTFADAAKKAQKESEERPNDPISQRGLEDIMYRLMTEQEAVRESRQQRKYSEGGKIHIAPSKKGTFTAAASKHGMGVQEFASKVLANPEDYSPAMRKKANFARNASKWKHAYGGLMGRIFEGDGDEPQSLVFLPNTGTDFFSYLTTPVKTPAQKQNDFWLAHHPETTGMPSPTRQTFGTLVKDPTTYIAPTTPTTPTTRGADGGTTYAEPKTSPLANLRYLPAIGSAINVFTDLMGWTNKPDYGNADMIVDAANQFGSVSFSPIGDYMTYTPLDRLFYANQLGAQAGATRRAILNTSGGNRGTAIAGLLAADYNAQGQLGNLFRQAEEYNLAQREKVAAFNRGTNMFNSEQGLKAAIANRERDKARIDALVKAAAIRDAVDSRVGAARSANLTNLFDSLGNIGREAATRNMILSNPALYYSIDSTGKITYKNGYESLSDAAKDEVNRHAAARTRTKAHGGYITIRRRR